MNGVDPILKERMFGLTGPQGNHGEDVKEYWWYLDGLRQPRSAPLAVSPPGRRRFLYQQLIDENARRSRDEPEFELMDTGVFDHGRYWAVDVAYAKARVTDGDSRQDHDQEPRRRGGDPLRAADPVVPQHLAVYRRGGSSVVPGW